MALTPAEELLSGAAGSTRAGIQELLGLTAAVSRFVEQTVNTVYTNELPSPEQVVRAFRGGLLTADQCKNLCQASGVFAPALAGARGLGAGAVFGYRDAWQKIWESTVTIPEPGELIFLLKMGKINGVDFNKYLGLNGVWSEDAQRFAFEVYQNQVPGPEELAHMAVKDCWNQAVVDRLGYDNEYPSQLDYWSEIMGGTGDARVKDAAGNLVGNPISWARMRWRAHWTTLSPTQMYEMFQRLRASRIQRFADVIPGVVPFTAADLDRGLLIADYPKTERQWLAAISYNRPRLVDIRRLFLDGTIDANECYELHLDYGYNPADARQLTDWLVGQRTRANTPKSRVNPSTAALQLYQIGLSDRGTTRNRLLAFLGGQHLSADKGVDLSGLPTGIQRQINTQADALLSQTDYRVSAKRATQVLATVRRRFLKGYLSEAESRTDLSVAGFLPTRIDDYISQWKLELQGGRLLASTAAIKRYVADGVITTQTAEVYLKNLGWVPPELDWLIAEDQHAREIELGRIAQQQARSRAAQARAVEQQHAAMRRQQAALQRRAAAQGTSQQVLRWYTHFVLDAPTAYNSLQSIWGDKTRAQRAIADATLARTEWGVKHGYLESRVAAAQIAADQAALQQAVTAAQQIAAAAAGSSATGTVAPPAQGQ